MAHIHDKIDFTVEVFIVYNNTVLLRKHDKYDLWLSVGGHIELDEDPNEAAIREVKEEVGLDIVLDDSLRKFTNNSENYTELIPPYFVNRHRINASHEHVTLTYLARSKGNMIVQPDGDERSKQCTWFTKQAILDATDLKESVKHYALRALEVLAS